MKVNNVQNYNYSAYTQKAEQRTSNNNLPFKGNIAINFWDAIARGGFAASFTVQDMTGTNFPRTYQALNRNKNITGENNYKAAAEVAVREFLTGPSMCIIPMFVLKGAKKISGSANEVPIEHIGVFSDKMKTILENTKTIIPNTEQVKDFPAAYAHDRKLDFYKKMFSLALGEDKSKTVQTSAIADELAEMLMVYDHKDTPKRGFFKQLLNKDIIAKADKGSTIKAGQKVKAKDQIMSDIITKFTDARKLMTGDYSDVLMTDMSGTLSGKKSITSLVKDFSNFGCDVEATMVSNAAKHGRTTSMNIDFPSLMEEFKTRRTGSKFLTNILMVAATAMFMWQIPKLYTMHETNPETDAFRSTEGEVARANK